MSQREFKGRGEKREAGRVAVFSQNEEESFGSRDSFIAS